jgi:predicted small secreted protein
MKKFSILLLLGILVSSFLITGCKRVRGDGNFKSEARKMHDFKGVNLRGSMDVHLEEGDSYSVTVDADANILPYIETEVDGGELVIGSENNVSLDPSKPIEIHVTAPSYNSISVAGSGNIFSKNQLDAGTKMVLSVSGSGNLEADVKAETVSADIAGSGAINLKGNARDIRSTISGSGDLVAAGFEAERGNFEVSGSGKVTIRITRELSGSIAGSGDIVYYGSPKVNTSIAGSGSVRKAE